jgi:conjugal transfer ATP-binding protein TraC
MIATFCKRLLFGAGDYLCAGDLQRMTSRSPFSAYLNYLAYDDQLEVYLNQDCSLGLLWECTPLTFAGPKTLTTLEGLFRAGLPGGSVLQLILHADTHIQPILDAYRVSRQVDEVLVRTNTERIIDFLDQGRSGLEACGNIPVRNFRLFVAVKLPGDSQEIPSPADLAEHSKTKPLQDIKRQISETLKAAMLAPRSLPPGELLEWARRLFNHYSREYPDHNLNTYDEAVPLRKQIINAETIIKE